MWASKTTLWTRACSNLYIFLLLAFWPPSSKRSIAAIIFPKRCISMITKGWPSSDLEHSTPKAGMNHFSKFSQITPQHKIWPNRTHHLTASKCFIICHTPETSKPPQADLLLKPGVLGQVSSSLTIFKGSKKPTGSTAPGSYKSLTYLSRVFFLCQPLPLVLTHEA